jgi:glycosyltransferase involved in cell wall biosynthesis
MESKFVFITPAYNCEKEISKTLFSMLSQSYTNWRAVFIDDVSDDNTSQIIEDISKSLNLGDKVKVIRREEKHGETKNTLKEIENIEDSEIVCRLDGGDWLTENDTLAYLDSIYRQYSPGVLWTNHRWAYTPRNISGPLNLNEGQTVYQHPWVSSHLKTFRASNLKRVPKSNFLDENGEWIMIACDQTVFLPMMHMCSQNKQSLIHFPLVCYHYSIDLEKPNLYHNERSYNQRDMALWVRERGFLNE